MGASGCGKSSLFSLLLRFYEPSSGEVAVHGSDIRTLPLEALRSDIAWVQQEPSLFNSSIGFNIGFPNFYPPPPSPGSEGVKPLPEQVQRIQRAAAAAGVADFVATLPEGYDTPCGTRGSQLSGGQKQRICIARALLRNARIMMFDEAT